MAVEGTLIENIYFGDESLTAAQSISRELRASIKRANATKAHPDLNPTLLEDSVVLMILAEILGHKYPNRRRVNVTPLDVHLAAGVIARRINEIGAASSPHAAHLKAKGLLAAVERAKGLQEAPEAR